MMMSHQAPGAGGYPQAQAPSLNFYGSAPVPGLPLGSSYPTPFGYPPAGAALQPAGSTRSGSGPPQAGRHATQASAAPVAMPVGPGYPGPLPTAEGTGGSCKVEAEGPGLPGRGHGGGSLGSAGRGGPGEAAGTSAGRAAGSTTTSDSLPMAGPAGAVAASTPVPMAGTPGQGTSLNNHRDHGGAAPWAHPSLGNYHHPIQHQYGHPSHGGHGVGATGSSGPLAGPAPVGASPSTAEPGPGLQGPEVKLEGCFAGQFEGTGAPDFEAQRHPSAYV